MPDWYVTRDGKERGPLRASKLKELVRAGGLRPDDLVRRSDRERATPAGKVRGLFEPSGPPPLPKAKAAGPPPLPDAATRSPPAPHGDPKTDDGVEEPSTFPVLTTAEPRSSRRKRSGGGWWSKTWPVLAVAIPLLGAGARFAKKAGWLDRAEPAVEARRVPGGDASFVGQDSQESAADPLAEYASNHGQAELDSLLDFFERWDAALAALDAAEAEVFGGGFEFGSAGHRRAIGGLSEAWIAVRNLTDEDRGRLARLGDGGSAFSREGHGSLATFVPQAENALRYAMRADASGSAGLRRWLSVYDSSASAVRRITAF